MGNVGRIFCVALPFLLTVASIIALLVATLAGVTDKSLYLFKVNTTDLSISSSSITSLLSDRDLSGTPTLTVRDDWASQVGQAAGSIESAASAAGSDASDIVASASAALASATQSASDAASSISSSVTGSSGTNITAADLGLADAYLISLWNYCEVTDGTKTCKKASYNWAANATESFEDMINDVASSMGENITLPSSVKSAMKTFSTITRWTEIVFIIAFIALAFEIILGFFANCSRAFSCCTTIIGMFATVAVVAAATLATATAAVVVAAVKGTAEAYGVNGSMNSRFLSAVWIAAAFAIAAGFFWLFTICCCAPDHRRARGGGAGGWTRSKHADEMGAVAPMSGAGGYQHLPGNTNSYQQHPTTSYQGAAGDYYGGESQKFESYRPVQQRY